jgi:hypothetical protein
MCSGIDRQPFKPTLSDLVLAAVTSTMPDEEGLLQPLAFTEEALGTYIEATYGVVPVGASLDHTLRHLLKDRSLHEYKKGGKYFYMMPRYSHEQFQRMHGYHPDVIEVGA